MSSSLRALKHGVSFLQLLASKFCFSLIKMYTNLKKDTTNFRLEIFESSYSTKQTNRTIFVLRMGGESDNGNFSLLYLLKNILT